MLVKVCALVLGAVCILTASVSGQSDCLRFRYRTIDGSCNNVNNPNWGKTGMPYNRFMDPDYADGRGASRHAKSGQDLPSARITSLHMSHDVNHEHPINSHMVMQWGQLINHDVTKKRTKEIPCCDDGMNANSNDPDCAPIPLPGDDPAFRKRCLSFVRSEPAFVNGRREQFNDVTGFVDASVVYGSTDAVARSLRTGQGGQLRSMNRPFGKQLLPTMQSDPHSFLSGDSRTNMIPSLAIVHVLLMREHNRVAERLAQANPNWDDETLYQPRFGFNPFLSLGYGKIHQKDLDTSVLERMVICGAEARKIVSAMVQKITYAEFLPVVMGINNMGPLGVQDNGYFEGYNQNINPSVSNGFAVAAYRFGHSLVQSHLKRITPDMREMPSPPLSDEFFNVSSIFNRNGEVDRIVMGLLNQKSQEADSSFSTQIQNNLFGGGGVGSDLYAINIQRGRDHGIPGYNGWRRFCNLPNVRGFQDLQGIVRPDALQALQGLYKDVDDIDLYAGGMAEFPLQGGLVGPTFACILTTQFSNSKQGDRFWYENGGHQGAFSPAQLNEVRKTSFARLICDNTDEIQRIQPQVMHVPANGNEPLPCDAIPGIDFSFWSEGQNQQRPPQNQQQPFRGPQVRPNEQVFIPPNQRPQQQQQNFRPQQQQQQNFRPPQQQQQNFRPQQQQNFRPQQQQNFRPQQQHQQQFRPNNDFRGPPQGQQNNRPFQQNQNQNRPQMFGTQQQFNKPQNFRRPDVGSNELNSQFHRPQQQRQPDGVPRPVKPGNPVQRRPMQSGPGFSQRPNPFQPPQQSFSGSFQQQRHRPDALQQLDNFDEEVGPLVEQLIQGSSLNIDPIRLFFQNKKPFEDIVSLQQAKPSVVLRVPGMSKEGDEKGTFGYVARF